MRLCVCCCRDSHCRLQTTRPQMNGVSYAMKEEEVRGEGGYVFLPYRSAPSMPPPQCMTLSEPVQARGGGSQRWAQGRVRVPSLGRVPPHSHERARRDTRGACASPPPPSTHPLPQPRERESQPVALASRSSSEWGQEGTVATGQGAGRVGSSNLFINEVPDFLRIPYKVFSPQTVLCVQINHR